MKNYAAKSFKIVLLAILIVALVAVFVACDGGNDNNTTNTNNGTGGANTGDNGSNDPTPAPEEPEEVESALLTTGYPSYEEVEAYLAYAYNNTREESSFAQIYFQLFDGVPSKEPVEFEKQYEGVRTNLIIATETKSTVFSLNILTYSTEELADSAYAAFSERFEPDNEEDNHYLKTGKTIMLGVTVDMNAHEEKYMQTEDEMFDAYKNILKSKLPDGAMSDERAEFVKDAYDEYCNENALEQEKAAFKYEIYNKYTTTLHDSGSSSREMTLNYEFFECDAEGKNSNAHRELVFSNNNEAVWGEHIADLNSYLEYYRGIEPNLTENYAQGSYIDFEREQGFVFADLIDKTE